MRAIMDFSKKGSFILLLIGALVYPVVSTSNLILYKGKASSYACDPKVDCELLGVGALVPDPEDCHKYYVCMNGVDGESVPSSVSLTCSVGQYFDQLTGSCSTEITPCQNDCYEICNLECHYALEFVAYPGNCSKYYLCLPGGETTVGDCPADKPYFNGTECTTEPYQCCDSCVPYCANLFVQIPDPNDCQSFYLCLSIGVPSEDYHQNCPSGQHFDSSSAVCVDGAVCSSICGDTSTTVTAKPPTTEHDTTEPPTTKPATTEPPTTKPATTEPPTTKPATTEPPTTKPATTEPPTAKPATTEPPTTKPATTEPSTTESTTIKPPTTESLTAEPTIIESTTTKPITEFSTTTVTTTDCHHTTDEHHHRTTTTEHHHKTTTKCPWFDDDCRQKELLKHKIVHQ